MSDIPHICDRLKEERKRLGFNQEEFAAIGGKSRRMQNDYEKNKAKPDAGYLSLIATSGADVQYILTGNKGGDSLSSASKTTTNRTLKQSIGYKETPPHDEKNPHGAISNQTIAPDDLNIRLDKVLDQYIYEDVLKSIVNIVDQALIEKGEALSESRKAILYRAAEARYPEFVRLGIEGNFRTALLAMIDIALLHPDN